MYTSAELQLLRNADPGVKIPSIDTPTGDPLAAASLKPLTSLENNAVPGVSYDPTENLVRVTAAGTVLSGYNFGSSGIPHFVNGLTSRVFGPHNGRTQGHKVPH